MQRKILVFFALGLLLCPPVLNYMTYGSADAEFIDTTAIWTSSDADFTGDMAWGDVDGDGDLDLAVANFGFNYLYLNDNGSIPRDPSWISDDDRDTFDLAWADFDSDGDLDLAAANRYHNNSIYLNVGGRLLKTPAWNSSDADFTTKVKWGDTDSDGDLDLVVSNYPGNLSVYENTNGKLGITPSWQSRDSYYAHTIILGDVNNDDKIDLVVGCGKLLGGDRNYIFFNSGKEFFGAPSWETQNPKRTTALDLGDYDRDGDLDLAYGTLNQGTYVHDNVNNNFTIKPTWSAGDTSTSCYDIAWADVTGNGWLDLILSVNGQNKIYKNNGGRLDSFASWHSDDDLGSSSIAVGDYDNDADLDVGFGSDLPWGEPNKLYLNNGTVYPIDPSWTATLSDRINSAAWYDVDDDGDLDLALGANGKNRIFFNKGTDLFTTSGWASSDSLDTRAIAWGDFDGDSDLDLVAGNYGSGNIAYRNDYGSLTTSAWWTSGQRANTVALAPGDVDGDGDLDLAVGNKGGPDYIYLNTGSGLATAYSWSSNDTSSTNDLSWGDLDGDGELDLAVAVSNQGVRVYHNSGNTLTDIPIWNSSYVNDTRTVSWADINGDGYMDLVTGAYQDMMYIYLNNNGSFKSTPSWQQRGSGHKTVKNCVLDINGDGRADVYEVNDGEPNRIFLNVKGELRGFQVWSTNQSGSSTDAAFGDMDKDGDLDVAVVNSNGRLEVYRSSYITDPVLINNPTYVRILSPAGPLSSSDYVYGLPFVGNVAVKYTLYDPEGAPASIVPEYSDNGGGTWHRASRSQMSGDDITGLTATATGNTYTFLWDTKKDNVVSKQVMFRITVRSVHDVPGRILRAGMSTHTGMFPVDSPKIHPPLNLHVTGVTTNSISLQWNSVSEEYVDGYRMYMNASYTGQGGPFVLEKTFGPVTNGTITGLADGITYYFRARSFNNAGIQSIFSNVASGTTIPLNLPPGKVKALPDVEMDEDSKLFNHFNLNDYFTDELSNSTIFGSDGLMYNITAGKDINCWISPNEWLSIEPPPNYFGREEFTVTASDGKFSVSMTFNVTVRSVNDMPILNLTDGTVFYTIQGEWFNTTITGYDPADPHDRLTFWTNTSLFEIEAETGNISFNPLPWDVGTHQVNITLTDDGVPNLRVWARVIVVINSTYIPPKSEPPISTLIYPEKDSTITTLRPSFMWDGRDGDDPVIWYDVFLAPEIDLVRGLSPFARVARWTTNITLSLDNDLTNGQIYYWTVIPYDGKVRGFCESGIWKFTVDVSQPEPVVELINPANRRTVNTDTVRLSWQLDYDGTEVVKYYVYFDISPVPKTLIASDITALSLDVKDLIDGETYYWTVRPRAKDVVGICSSGTWSFSVNLNFTQNYCVSVMTGDTIYVKVNETRLHDVTIINCGNDVDTYLISLIPGDLEGAVSLQSEWIRLIDLGSGFLELEPNQGITISLLFGIHSEKLMGIHDIAVSVTSLGAQYSDLKVKEIRNITVNVLDQSGNGIWNNVDPNGTGDKPGPDMNNTNGTKPDKPPITNYYRISVFNWFWIILAIIIAIIFLVSYTSYLMRKTRKKFEVYKTAQEILESKKIDTASPLVAGFLAAGAGKSGEVESALADIDLTPMEVETVTEAFVIGSGVYTQAKEELSIVERPYSAAAKQLLGDDYASYKVSRKPEKAVPKAAPVPAPVPVAKAYSPKRVEVGPVSPYTMARRDYAVQLTKPVPSGEVVPMARPAAAEVIAPDEMDTKMKLLEKRLKEGKISEEQYEKLRSKFAEAKPALPVAEKAEKSYRPDYMYLRSEKPYDMAAKRVKLEQALREGKISRRLYEELMTNYQ